MRNTKAIDPSLNKKIKENDERLRELYEKEYKFAGLQKSNTGRNRSYQKAQKKKKNIDDSFSDTNIKTYNDVDAEPSYRTEEIIEKEPKPMEIQKKRPSSNASRMQKRMKFQKDKEEKKNTTTVIVNNNLEKPKKAYNKEQVDEMVNRLYNNDYKHRKPAYKEEETKKVVENEPDIDEFIERVEEYKKKRNENL